MQSCLFDKEQDKRMPKFFKINSTVAKLVASNALLLGITGVIFRAANSYTRDFQNCYQERTRALRPFTEADQKLFSQEFESDYATNVLVQYVYSSEEEMMLAAAALLYVLMVVVGVSAACDVALDRAQEPPSKPGMA
jgi:thiamine monophosphate synthase